MGVHICNTQSLVRDGANFRAHYQVALPSGALLTVTVPAALTDEDAGLVCAQLRELVCSLEVTPSCTGDEELTAREAVLRGAERFLIESSVPTDWNAARALLADYHAYVTGVAVYLRTLSSHLAATR